MLARAVRKFWILILVWQAASYKQERKEKNREMDFKTLPGTERNRGTPCFILSGPYRRNSLPSFYCLWLVHQSRVNSCMFLFRCLNDWTFCVSCWKIKMAKTLSADSAKPELGPHFSQESSTAGGPLLKNCF